MKNPSPLISPSCRRRLQVQGYVNYSDQELSNYKFGIRFAYGSCITLVAIGLTFKSLPILIVIAVIAFGGMFPPYHPFDYLYNYGVRHLLHKPKLPPRTNQGRFACGIASAWLSATIYFLLNNNVLMFYVFGWSLFSVGALVTFTDICIPSIIYNALFYKRAK